jgi:hypothetical protein
MKPAYDVRIRDYTGAVQNYGVAFGISQGSEDSAGWRKELAKRARKARDWAQLLADAHPDTTDWKDEVAYWQQRIDWDSGSVKTRSSGAVV